MISLPYWCKSSINKSAWLFIYVVKYILKFFPQPLENLVGGFNPFEKHQSNWIISPSRDENKQNYLKPPPSFSPAQATTNHQNVYDEWFTWKCPNLQISKIERVDIHHGNLRGPPLLCYHPTRKYGLILTLHKFMIFNNPLIRAVFPGFPWMAWRGMTIVWPYKFPWKLQVEATKTQ